MNISSSSIKVFGGKIANAGIGLLGITYFSQELGPSIMGTFFLFEALLGLLSIPSDFGIRGALEKRVSEGDSQGEFLMGAIALKLFPILFIIICIFSFMDLINSYLGMDIGIYLVVVLVVNEVAELGIFALKGELRVGEVAELEVIHQIIWVLIGFILVSQGYGLYGLIYGLLLGLSTKSLLCFYKSSITPRLPSRKHILYIFNYAKFNVLSSIGSYFYNWVDVLIIGAFLSQSHVGAYEIAWRVASAVILLSKSIAMSLFPKISRFDAKGQRDRISKNIEEVITPSMFLVIPSFFGVLVFSKDILVLFFGEEFGIAWLVLIVLMAEKIFQSIHLILGPTLQGIDKPKLAAYATGFSLVLNLVLNLFLVTRYGIVGVSIATLVSFLANTLLHGYFLHFYIRVSLPLNEIIWCIASSIVMAVILFYVKSTIVTIDRIKLLMLILTGSIIYFSSVLTHASLREKLLSWGGMILHT